MYMLFFVKVIKICIIYVAVTKLRQYILKIKNVQFRPSFEIFKSYS